MEFNKTLKYLQNYFIHLYNPSRGRFIFPFYLIKLTLALLAQKKSKVYKGCTSFSNRPVYTAL